MSRAWVRFGWVVAAGVGVPVAAAAAAPAAAVPEATAAVADSVAIAAPAPAAPAEGRQPLVVGGYDDKPYVRGVFGRIAVGGYVEGRAALERVKGATEEAGFELTRLNLLASARIGRPLEFWTEIEFEDAGEEVTVELAQLDVRMRPELNARVGILLSPLGRFNLAHDAPRNLFTARPLVSTELVGVALSEPGLGVFGTFREGKNARMTYELYAVNGFGDGLILDSPEGTRIARGRHNIEDNNASPAFVGRLAVSPVRDVEIGLSAHHGAYNVFEVEGQRIDRRRDLFIRVLDVGASVARWKLAGEAAIATVDVPESLHGIFAQRQAGGYLELGRTLLSGAFRALPGSSLGAAVRFEGIDFDTERAGDSRRRFSLSLNLRPAPEAVFRLGYFREESRDRFNNLERAASLHASFATYY